MEQILPSLADIGGTIFVGYLMFRLASNHILHNTETMGELKNTLKDLTNFLKNGK